MDQGNLMQSLTQHNVWWSRPDWEADDPDLRRIAQAPFDYQPDPLRTVRPDGLYFLRGPRRIGKSVELKRKISSLIRSGVAARSIVHFACNGLTPTDVRNLVLAAQRLLGPTDQPRYWFLDEIAAAGSGWWDAIAHLRDNNAGFQQDCVVLSGSSTRGLDEAVKALADRRGQAVLGTDLLLLPMSFRSFCAVVEPHRTFPQPDALHPRDLADPAVWPGRCYELAPFLNDLVQLWDLFLTVGGFPKAVWNHVAPSPASPSEAFVQGLWQVIFGEAIRSAAYPQVQVQRLLAELGQRLASPTNFTQLAEDCGFSDHSVASDRCNDLVAAYLLWPCYPIGDNGLPRLLSQRKFYFYDPLLARLASLLDNRNPTPSQDVLSEQQLGLALLRAIHRDGAGSIEDYSQLMFMKTPSRSEIDFVGPRFDPVAFESKFIDKKDTKGTATIKASGKTGFMASRAFFDPEASVPWLPAAFVAWLLDDAT